MSHFSRLLIAIMVIAVTPGFVRPAHAALSEVAEISVVVASGCLSLVAIVLSAVSFNRQKKVLRDQASILSMVEKALTDYAHRSEQEVRTITELTDTARMELGELSKALSARHDRVDMQQETENLNTVDHQDRMKAETAQTRKLRSDEKDNMEALLGKGEFDIALEPIVSLEQSAAAGFISHAVIGGYDRYVRRLVNRPSKGSTLAFETALVNKSAVAARDSLRSGDHALPIYVSVSPSFLDSRTSTEELLRVQKLQPEYHDLIQLMVPTDIFTNATEERLRMLGKLNKAGLHLACEGWPQGKETILSLRKRGVTKLLVTCHRLLEREKARRDDLSAFQIMDACEEAGMKVIATHVETDTDAINLIDLGVDLMCGPRFSEPRQLKPERADMASRTISGHNI